jgi:hypothetical protein
MFQCFEVLDVVMSYLTEVNCTSILEAIKNEKKNQHVKENGAYLLWFWRSVFVCSILISIFFFIQADDYVLLYKVNTFWTDLFAKCFLCDGRLSRQQDDMLFFVTKPIDSSINNHVIKEKVHIKLFSSQLIQIKTSVS